MEAKIIDGNKSTFGYLDDGMRVLSKAWFDQRVVAVPSLERARELRVSDFSDRLLGELFYFGQNSSEKGATWREVRKVYRVVSLGEPVVEPEANPLEWAAQRGLWLYMSFERDIYSWGHVIGKFLDNTSWQHLAHAGVGMDALRKEMIGDLMYLLSLLVKYDRGEFVFEYLRFKDGVKETCKDGYAIEALAHSFACVLAHCGMYKESELFVVYTGLRRDETLRQCALIYAGKSDYYHAFCCCSDIKNIKKKDASFRECALMFIGAGKLKFAGEFCSYMGEGALGAYGACATECIGKSNEDAAWYLIEKSEDESGWIHGLCAQAFALRGDLDKALGYCGLAQGYEQWASYRCACAFAKRGEVELAQKFVKFSGKFMNRATLRSMKALIERGSYNKAATWFATLQSGPLKARAAGICAKASAQKSDISGFFYYVFAEDGLDADTRARVCRDSAVIYAKNRNKEMMILCQNSAQAFKDEAIEACEAIAHEDRQAVIFGKQLKVFGCFLSLLKHIARLEKC